MFSSLFAYLSVYLLATLRKNFRTDCVKFFGKVGNEPMNKRLNFGGDPDHDIRIATLVRRALAELRPVPMLLVYYLTVPS